jgi:ATPase subunit of ABC transporter with duplicated ATPase domains
MQVGFTQAQWTLPVGSLSGGWKMKLALGERVLGSVAAKPVG